MRFSGSVEALKRSGLFSALMILASMISFSKIIFFSKFLTVSQFGAYSLIVFIAAPISFVIGFALEPGFLREGAICLGAKKYWKFNYLRDSCISFSIISILIAFVISLMAYFLFQGTEIAVYLFALPLASANLFFGLVATSQRILASLNYYVGLLLLKHVLTLCLALPLISTFGLHSTLFAEILIPIVLATSAFIRTKQKFIWPIKFKPIRGIFKSGGPVSITYLVGSISSHSDKYVLPLVLTSHDYGLFSFSLIFFAIGAAVANIITTVLVPSLTKSYATNTSIKEMLSQYYGKMRFLPVVVIMTLIFLYFISKKGVQIFFPDYLDSVSVFPFILSALFFYFLNLKECMFLVLNKGYSMLRNNVAVAAVSLVCYGVGIFYSFNLVLFSKIFLAVKIFQYALTEFSLYRVGVKSD